MAQILRGNWRSESPAVALSNEIRNEVLDDNGPRSLRVAFHRRSPEEQSLRRSTIAEVVRQTTDSAGTSGCNIALSAAATAGLPPRADQLIYNGRGGAGSRTRVQHANNYEGPLRFSSAFECGNLLGAKLVVGGKTQGGGSVSSTAVPQRRGGAASPATSTSPEPRISKTVSAHDLEYELQMDSDTQSPAGHTQWFFFAVRTGDFKGTVHFRIVNMRKKKSLYQQGLQPHCLSLRRNRGWEPFSCHDVSYVPNCSSHVNHHHARKNGTDAIKPDQHTLAFSYAFEHTEDEVYFAAYPPYTYTMLLQFLSNISEHSCAAPHFRRTDLCRSIGQLPVPLLVVSQDISAAPEAHGKDAEGSHSKATSPSFANTVDAKTKSSRPAIAIIARQHPGEVVGSWAMQGLLKFLLGPSQIAERLREENVFHIVPMVNVDGVVHGNSRCTLAGVDPNRMWHDPNPIIHPVIYALKGYLRNVSQNCNKHIELFLDFHGHSARTGCFFYGSSPSAPIGDALFPKLCSIATRDICFEKCRWRCPKSHRRTARYIAYKNLGVKHSFTMECSLFAPAGSSVSSASRGRRKLSAESLSSQETDEDSEERYQRGPLSGRVQGRETAEGTLSQESEDDSENNRNGGHLEEESVARPLRLTAPGTSKGHFTTERVEWIGVAVGHAIAAFTGVTLSGQADDFHANTSCQACQGNGEGLSNFQGAPSDPSGDTVAGRTLFSSRIAHRWMDFKIANAKLFEDFWCSENINKRQWVRFSALHATPFSEVLHDLNNTYGDTVPDFGKGFRGDCSDDGGDSDGDDGPELDSTENEIVASRERTASAKEMFQTGANGNAGPPRLPRGKQSGRDFGARIAPPRVLVSVSPITNQQGSGDASPVGADDAVAATSSANAIATCLKKRTGNIVASHGSVSGNASNYASRSAHGTRARSVERRSYSPESGRRTNNSSESTACLPPTLGAGLGAAQMPWQITAKADCRSRPSKESAVYHLWPVEGAIRSCGATSEAAGGLPGGGSSGRSVARSPQNENVPQPPPPSRRPAPPVCSGRYVAAVPVDVDAQLPPTQGCPNSRGAGSSHRRNGAFSVCNASRQARISLSSAQDRAERQRPTSGLHDDDGATSHLIQPILISRPLASAARKANAIGTTGFAGSSPPQIVSIAGQDLNGSVGVIPHGVPRP